MRDGKCGRCGKETVHASAESRVQGVVTMQIGVLMHARLVPYVCVSCGYTECYVEDQERLERIAAKWPRVKA